jgi:hypothetical protein
MNNVLKLLSVAGIVAASVAPVAAQTVVGDPMTTNCSDYATQDEAGKMSLAMQLNAYNAMSDAERTAIEEMSPEEVAAMIADGQAARAEMSAEDMAAATAAAESTMTKITTNCQASPESTVVDAMDKAM